MRRTPALIVGGGPAGAAAAIVLARAGAPHLLVERSRETGDALCGGFLSWRTLAELQRLGVDEAALGPARVTRVRVLTATRVAEARLPRPALGVSRYRLDTVMLDRARALGAAVERGVAVRSIAGGVRTDDGATIGHDALFLASGKHDVRGLPRPAAARGDDPALGLRLRLAASPALDRLVGDAVELHLFDRGYAGAVRQEDGSVNLCLAVRRSRLRMAGDPAALLRAIGDELPALGDRLGHLDSPIIDAVANVPYGWRTPAGPAGLFRLGDQAGVIPSLAGEGLAIAITSGSDAARAYVRGGAAAAPNWQASFRTALRRPIGLAAIIRGVAERPALATPMVAAVSRAPALLRVMALATRTRVARRD